MRNLTKLALLLIFLSASAFGIGRSGNGNVNSSTLGFSAHIPDYFPDTKPLSGDALRVSYAGFEYSSEGMFQPFIDISPVGNYFPELSGKSREEIQKHFANLKWTKKSLLTCVDLYLQPDSQVNVLVWGRNKGISLIGNDSASVKLGISEIISTFQLLPGACAW